MKNSSVKTKKDNLRLEDYKFLEPLNYDRSAHIVQHTTNGKKYILKQVELGQTNQVKEASRINSMMNATHSNLLKPESFCFRYNQITKCSTLCILSPRYALSLEKMIVHHRNEKEHLPRQFVERFIISMYNLVGKLNEQQNIYSCNLKPSNIFYHNEEWYVAQFGVPTCRINKYYAKGFDHTFAKGRSIQFWLKGDQPGSDKDLYSLGVVIMEMITLEKIDTMIKTLDQYKSQRETMSLEASKTYGDQMVDFAKSLIFSSQSSKMAFKRFKESTKIEYNSTQRFQFRDLQCRDYDHAVPGLQRFIHAFKQQQPMSDKMLTMFKRYDPELSFILPNMADLARIASDFGYRENPNMVDIWLYYTVLSQMRYVNLVKDICPQEDVVKSVINLGVENYKDEKEFFISQTNGKQYWSSDEILVFFKKCEVEFELELLKDLVREWTKDPTKTYLSLEDLRAVLGKQSKTETVFRNQMSDVRNPISRVPSQKSTDSRAPSNPQPFLDQDQLENMLSLLKKYSDDNLFKFFKEYDPKCRWVNDFVIQRVIKESIVMSEQKFKRATETMWSIGGIPGKSKQDYKLKYLVLLKETKQYDAVQLFKLVLTEMINYSDFESLFDRYKVQGRNGWSEDSLLSLNEDQMLEFHQREIRQVFRDLDKDGSKIISSQEMIFKLTGLKEFNQSVYIEMLKEMKQKNRVNLIQQFMKNDTNCDLDLESVPQLAKTIRGLGLDISQDHAEKLFHLYDFNDQFDYVKFLRHFYSLFQLFRQCVLFVLKQHYKSDFQRIYTMGLEGKSRKWNNKSIVKVNDQLVMGFTQKELGKVWEEFDKNGDLSLNKEEVATIFGARFQKDIDSSTYIRDYDEAEVDDRLDSRKPELSRRASKTAKNDLDLEKPFKQRLEQELEKNEVLYELREKAKKRDVLAFFLDEDKSKTFALKPSEFQEVLRQLGIVYKSRALQECLKDFRFQDRGQTRINFIKILMFFNTLDQEEEQAKSKTLSRVISAYLKKNRLEVRDVVKNSRQKNRWTLPLMERWIKDSFVADIYFDDLEVVWNYWGQESIGAEQLEKILNNQGKVKARGVRRDKVERTGDSRAKEKEGGKQRYHQDTRNRPADDDRDRFGKSRKTGSVQKDNPKERRAYAEENHRDEHKYRESLRYENDRREKSPQEKQTGHKSPPKSSQKSPNRYDRQYRNEPLHSSVERHSFSKTGKDQPTANQRQSNFNMTLKIPNRQDYTNNYKTRQHKDKSDLASRVKKYGFGKIQAVSKGGYVDSNDLRKCLVMHYGVEDQEITEMIRGIQRNKRVKLVDLKEMVESELSEVNSRMERTSAEFEPSGVYQRDLYLGSDRRSKPNKSLAMENIKILMSAFSHKRKLSELDKYMFQGVEYLQMESFVKRWKNITEAVTSQGLEQIFKLLKPVQGQVSLVSFKLFFHNEGSAQTTGVEFPPDIEKQLRQIFSRGDTDNSKRIERNQLAGLLSQLGINFNNKDIEIHFKDMDSDGRNSIDLDQFKSYVLRHVFKYVGDFQQHIDGVHQAFLEADMTGSQLLTVDQFKDTTIRLKISLTDNQIVALFRGLGGGTSIPIDKLMECLIDVDKFAGNKMPLYKIRFGKRLTIKDIRGVFSKLSTGYTISYCSIITKRRQLTPSSSLRPVLDDSDLFFRDFYYTNVSRIDPAQPCLQRVPNYNQLVLMIKLDQATGVPIPLESIINRNNIVRRYLSVTFLDTNQQRIRDSICEVDAVWDPDNEDIWSFNGDKGFERQLIVKLGDYAPQKFDNMVLMFEFALTYIENGSTLEINCGSTSLPIKQVCRITSGIDKKLEIAGGIPTKRKYFKKEDVNARRSGWKKLFNSGDVESVLKIQVLPASKFKDKVGLTQTLPMRIICNLSSLNLFYCFREFFAERSVQKSKVNILFSSDRRVQTFLASVDCRNIFVQLVPFWNRTVIPKCGSLQLLKGALEILMDELESVLLNREFGFTPSYPTYNCLGDKSLTIKRDKLVKDALQNVSLLMKKQPKKHKIEAAGQLKAVVLASDREDNILKTLKSRR